MQRLLECVPNFSEGRDPAVLEALSAAIEEVEGVLLLDVDPGHATNRTVFTFVGEPEAVVEAAFRAAARAAELIDMRSHSGEHPRFGAMDVCPLVPVAGVTMEEAVEYARALGRRIGEELDVPVYLYERAATSDARRNLAEVRAGEYEGLPAKLADPAWKPDFGPAAMRPKFGAVAVGARDFLVAYNINLNTTSTRRANAIAFDVRERGRVQRDSKTGEVRRDAKGEPVHKPGRLKAVKAIGWYIEEYGIAQISMNLTDIATTPLHVAFEETVACAEARGVRVTGSELVGLVPLRAMLEAGRYFLRRQRRSTGVSESELVKIAVRTLGLGDLKPFRPEEKIIEYAIAARHPQKRLVDASVRAFTEVTASEAPAPGGGSVAAAIGALGAALGTMVANLSAHKRGWDDRWEEFSDWAERGMALTERLLWLVDEDTRAFDALMTALRGPDGPERESAVQAATERAMRTPLAVMEAAIESFPVLAAMAEIGNPNSVSDAGVGALCARSAVLGAHLNVRINAPGLADERVRSELLAQAAEMAQRAAGLEADVLATVESKLEV